MAVSYRVRVRGTALDAIVTTLNGQGDGRVLRKALPHMDSRAVRLVKVTPLTESGCHSVGAMSGTALAGW